MIFNDNLKEKNINQTNASHKTNQYNAVTRVKFNKNYDIGNLVNDYNLLK